MSLSPLKLSLLHLLKNLYVCIFVIRKYKINSNKKIITMTKELWINLPVKDINISKEFLPNWDFLLTQGSAIIMIWPA